MMATKPIPMSVDEFVKSATMFYIDQQLEQEYSAVVASSVTELQTRLLGIATLEGLNAYIRDDKQALDRITSLLNISEEKFKRIVTMFRVQKGFAVTSEWGLSKIRVQMIESAVFMDEICELFMKGVSVEKYKSLIPNYYLENFSIDVATLGRLASPDDIRRFVKKGLEGQYNNKLGDSFFKSALVIISDVCKQNGLTYVVKKTIPIAGKTISVAIPDETNPKLLINITYGITTSSGQTTYAKSAEDVAAKLRVRNDGKEHRERILFVNVLDGAGWVARHSDLGKIHRCSDYLLNLTSLGKIEDIITYIFGGINQ